ncbi:MAG: hypothetical protein JJT94_16140 [Bernardetiaceae bacterium]|nr:hypothetical protein [Bernardetiaceae bacterium]
MKKIIFTAVMLFSIHLTNAQINAITETGDEVILYNDGTWKYLDDKGAAGEIAVDKKIYVNDKKITVEKESSFLVKSNKLNIGVWINPKKWTFAKGKDNDAQEFQFQMKGNDLYAALITEKIQIPVESLRELVVINAKSVANDIEVVKEEYRNVNGVQVLMLKMIATMQGVRFIYCGYYYSNANGTVQLITYTGENLFENYLTEIELLLNGLVDL